MDLLFAGGGLRAGWRRIVPLYKVRYAAVVAAPHDGVRGFVAQAGHRVRGLRRRPRRCSFAGSRFRFCLRCASPAGSLCLAVSLRSAHDAAFGIGSYTGLWERGGFADPGPAGSLPWGFSPRASLPAGAAERSAFSRVAAAWARPAMTSRGLLIWAIRFSFGTILPWMVRPSCKGGCRRFRFWRGVG
jgi:hypothetical protein